MRWIFFFEGPKPWNSTFWMSAYGFVFLWGKSKMKFLLASMKSLANCEIPFSIPLKKACSGFLIATCAFKSCCESRFECTLDQMDQWEQRKPEQKFDVAFRTTFRISKCFQRSKLKMPFDFSLELRRLEIEKTFAHEKKVLSKIVMKLKGHVHTLLVMERDTPLRPH